MFAYVRACLCTYAIRAGLWNFGFSDTVPMETIVLRNYPGGSFMCHLRDKAKKRWIFPCPRYGGVWGSRVIAPFILNLGNRWRWVVKFMPRRLHLQNRTPVAVRYETQICNLVQWYNALQIRGRKEREGGAGGMVEGWSRIRNENIEKLFTVEFQRTAVIS